MKKLFYSLVTLLSLYIVFFGLRLYKQRADSVFIKKIINVQQLLYDKISKVNHIKDSCTRKISEIEKKTKSQDKDHGADIDVTKMQTEATFYKNIKDKAEEGLVILETKEKELNNYIYKCNQGFISRSLRKETNEYLTKYVEKESELDEIVESIEKQFNNENKKAKDEVKKNKHEDSEKNVAKNKQDDIKKDTAKNKHDENKKDIAKNKHDDNKKDIAKNKHDDNKKNIAKNKHGDNKKNIAKKKRSDGKK